MTAPQKIELNGRLKPYPNYKETGIKWFRRLPAHWHVDKIKYIATVQPSNVDKKSEDGELPVKLCNYVNVYYHDRITADMDFMEATATPAEKRKFQLQAGDVCVTKDSEAWRTPARSDAPRSCQEPGPRPERTPPSSW